MRVDPPTLSLAFDGWERRADVVSFAKSADPDDVERRYPTGERDGALVLFWPSRGKAVMHGGRVQVGRRKVVTSCLVVADVFPATPPSDPDTSVDPKPYWREVFSPSATNEQQLMRGPARWNHAGVLYDESGTLVLHGGKDSHGVVCNDVVLFNFRRQSWENFSRWAGGCEAPALFGHAMAPLPVGAIVVLGPLATRRAKRGSCEDASERETMALFLLDLAGSDKQWRSVAAPAGGPPPRRNFAMSVSAEGRSLVVGGGIYRSAKLRDIWCMDFTSNLWTEICTTSMSPYAALHISAAHGAVISLSSKGASVAPVSSSGGLRDVTAVAEAGAASADLHVFVRPRAEGAHGSAEHGAERREASVAAPFVASVVAIDNRGAVFLGSVTLTRAKAAGEVPSVSAAVSQAATAGGFLL